jgi:hypothetical protein
MRIFSVVTHTTPNAKNASLQLGGTFMETLSQVASMPIYLLLGFSTDCILYHGTRNSNSSATIFSMAQREKSLEPSR